MANEFENISLFDLDAKTSISSKLDVVKLEYVSAEHSTWEELFSGFDDLKAITFSSGIIFIYRLFDMFETAEVIFGCEGVMSYSLQELMAYQGNLESSFTEEIHAKLATMMEIAKQFYQDFENYVYSDQSSEDYTEEIKKALIIVQRIGSLYAPIFKSRYIQKQIS